MISSKIFIPIIIGLACVIALIVGANLAIDADHTMVFTALIGMIFVLMVFAREYWWIALFIAVGFGGYAYFGFKILAHEFLLGVAMAGLLPSVALNPQSEFNSTRPKLPWFFYVTVAYLLFQIVYSISTYTPYNFIEVGNIVRAYMNGLWPLLFVFLFRFFGRSDYLPFALYLLQTVYLARALMTLATIYLPSTMMLPGINFMLPGNVMNGGGLDDLRFSGHGICLLACAILLGRPNFFIKLWQYSLLLFAFFAQAMSGGRLLLVASILAVVAAFAVARMWKTVITAATAAIALIVFLNLFPRSINTLDRRMQRALSILILDSGATEARFQTIGSDIWHARLAEVGYKRWTNSPKSILIGTGIRPWDATIVRETTWTQKFEALINGAADTGNYESGLWTILAPTGLIGFLLYGMTITGFVFYNSKLLVRGKLRNTNLTITFLGTYPALEWLIFSPRAGGYPALEILFACTAFYYLHDHKNSVTTTDVVTTFDEGSVYSEA